MTPYVLVVEDEDALATLLDYNLMKEGFRVERAADGEEALLRVAEEPPDLVVLDWMLPKVSGVEVCRQLRAGAETRRTPVLMLTARGEEADKVRGLDTGAEGAGAPDPFTNLNTPEDLEAARAGPAAGTDG